MTTRVGLYHYPRKRLPWVVRWFGETDPSAGGQRRYSKSFRLRRDAESFQASKQAEFNKGAQRDRPPDLTLGAFCKKYLTRRQHEWAEKTRLQIDDLCNRLIEHFGADTLLRTITRDKATAMWSQARMRRHKHEGEELSRYSQNRILRDAKTMFKYAVEWGDLMINPFTHMRSIRVGKRNRQKWHYVKPEEYLAMLKAAPTLQWKVFYALAYTSGARFGELVNLTEQNVDFPRGRLLIRNREGTKEMPPFHVKDHEDREVPLPRHTLKLLAAWFRVRPKGSPFILISPTRFAVVQKRWRSCRDTGKPWINDYMVNNTLRSIRVHAKRAGLKLDGVLTIHCFRKSCGQNWANHLPMNVVKELMGHAHISTTAEFYSAVSEEHEAKAQWVIEAITVGQRKTTDAGLTPEPENRSNRKAG